MMPAQHAARTVSVARTTAVTGCAVTPAKPASTAQRAARLVRYAALPAAVPRGRPVSVTRAAQLLRRAAMSAARRGKPASVARAAQLLTCAALSAAVNRAKCVSAERAARLTARAARRVAMTAAVGPALPAAPPARHVLTAPAVARTGALARRAPTVARKSASRAPAQQPAPRAVTPVSWTLSVARATAPTGIAVIPATPMSAGRGRAVQMLTSVVRSVVHPAKNAAVAIASSVAPTATALSATSAILRCASPVEVVSSPARRL